MKRISHKQPAEIADGSQAFFVVGRVLLALTLTLVVVMPWSESFCHFDQFLRGGQDFELGLLAFATLLCLVLVLLQDRGQGVRLLLAMQRWLSLISRVKVAWVRMGGMVVRPRARDAFSCPADCCLNGTFVPLRI